MHTERKILANLAWRVYKARHNMSERRRLYVGTKNENLFWEALFSCEALELAFDSAKQIYFDNLPKD
jgi:hypothetical protein